MEIGKILKEKLYNIERDNMVAKIPENIQMALYHDINIYGAERGDRQYYTSVCVA